MRADCPASIALAGLLLAAGCQGPPAFVAGPGVGGDSVGGMAGFSWVEDGQLAGMPRPGGSRELVADLEFIAGQGIEVLVSLTVVPTSPERAADYGIDVVHIPIVDFTAPSQDQIRHFVAVVEQANSQNRAVGVHCGAGLGRTGTMLAAWLVSRGMTAAQALDTIRRLRPGSVETEEQEQAIARYHEALVRGADSHDSGAGAEGGAGQGQQ